VEDFFAVFAAATAARFSAAAAAADSNGKKVLPSVDMSFLFHKRNKKIIKIAWGFIAVIVMLGMVVFFAPGLINIIAG